TSSTAGSGSRPGTRRPARPRGRAGAWPRPRRGTAGAPPGGGWSGRRPPTIEAEGRSMVETKDQMWKVAEETTPQRIEDLVKAGANPVGLDVGTSKVVASRRQGREIQSTSQLNAFLPVAYTPFTERTLQQSDIHYYRDGDELVIYGTSTERFANMFNAESH